MVAGPISPVSEPEYKTHGRRDMTATNRYPPCPRFPPIAFYSSVRFADPEQLGLIMGVDPYFITQDNGAGAPIHFAVTYCRLDMVHHLLNNGAEVNQQDYSQGLTPLHRAAYLAHLDGYLEMYEYLLSRGADPSIPTTKYDEYLNPGPKVASDLACSPDVADMLKHLEARYATVPKAPKPSAFIGCWWTLYDYGLDTVKSWSYEYEPDFPEERKRKKEATVKAARAAEKKAQRQQFLQVLEQQGPEAARALAASFKAAKPVLAAPGSADTGNAILATPRPADAPYTAFLFPGQGSQAVGMLKDSSHLPEVKAMLDTASKVLGYDLLQRCLEGPKDLLDDTQVAQPALLVAGLAAAVVAKQQEGGPGVEAACAAAAGLSLGEYSALVWAGALNFEDGIKVVKARGEAMAAAAKQGPPHGMLSIVGLTDIDLEGLCKRVLQQVSVPGGTVCQVANYLFPQGRVVSGHIQALDKLKDLAVSAGALKAQMLAVSGAFHTRLMEPASKALAQVLDSVTVNTPRITVYSNVTAEPFPSDPAGIKRLLAQQLVMPVQWEATLQQLIKCGNAGPGGVAQLYELGPGQQIKAMVRRLDSPTWKAFKNVAA